MIEIAILVSILLLIAVLLYAQRKILKELKNIKIPLPQKIEFPPAKEIVLDLNPVVEAVKNISIPPPQNIEFPKMEFPKIEIPPAKEIVLDLNPVVEAVKNISIPPPQNIEFPKMEFPKIEIPPAKEIALNLEPVIEAIKSIHIPEPQKIEIPPTKEININTESLQEIVTLMRVNQAEFQSSLDTFHKAIDKLLTQIPTGEKELNSQKEFMQKFEEAFVKVQETAAEAMNENSLRLQEILTEFLNREAK